MKKDWMVKESELDDDQLRILMAVLDKSMVVEGCAGSGKSILALMKAQRIQNERSDNYVVYVFTKALCAYMQEGRQALGLRGRFLYNRAPNAPLQCPQADYIIVDEIQDFTREEVQTFIKATRKNFFFFGDTSQSIYQNFKNTLPVNAILGLFPPNNCPRHDPLYRNYRLPVHVAELAQHVGIGLNPFDRGIYKSPYMDMPYVLYFDNLRAQVEFISQALKKNDHDDAVIIAKDNNAVDVIHELLDNMGIKHELKSKNTGYTLNFNSDNPKVMTVHSAKGLQFRTVFVVGVEEFSGNNDYRSMLYVAMTRTYRHLYLLHSGPLPFYFPPASSGLYKTSVTSEETTKDI